MVDKAVVWVKSSRVCKGRKRSRMRMEPIFKGWWRKRSPQKRLRSVITEF